MSENGKELSDILNSRTVTSLKANTEAFLRCVESADDMHGWMIQNRFCDAVAERDTAYQRKTPGLPYNAVIIPPEFAPAAMIPTFVPLTGKHYEFVDGLKRLIGHCDDIVDPIYPAITETGIRAVLSAAQRAFGMIDIIAPNYPLRIYRFDCSHKRYNSECAVMSGDSRRSVIFLYHPRQNKTYDRVFIFAHELGHALHFALTGDMDVFPDGFDSFNDRLGTKLDTLEDKQ